MAWMETFLARLRELLQAKVKDGDITAEEFDAAVRQARSHVGGLAAAAKWRADKEAAEVDSRGESEGAEHQASEEVANVRGWPLLTGPLALSEDGRTATVQIFPKVGTYKHPTYGELQITPAFLADIKRNFDQRVYQQDLPLQVDLEHQSSLSGAAGWIKDIEVRGSDGAWATLELNDRGVALVKDGGYKYYSPEYYDRWQDPASAKSYANVCVGGGLTNRPFFKGMDPIVLGSEGGLLAFTELATEPVEAGEVKEAKDVDPGVGGGVDRDKLPESDFAGKNRSFPIVTPGDVSDAVSSMGRAGPDNYSPDELKRRIIAICKRKGEAFMRALPQAWKDEMGMGKAAAENPAARGGRSMDEEQVKRLTELESSLKTLTEQLAAKDAAIQAAEKAAREATDKAANLERADRRRALSEEVRGHRLAYQGEVDAVVDRLEVLQAKLTPEEFAGELADRRAIHARLAESDLLGQVSGAGAPVGAQAQIDTLVRKLMTERNLAEPEAIQMVIRENPRLYAQVEREHNRRGQRGGD